MDFTQEMQKNEHGENHVIPSHSPFLFLSFFKYYNIVQLHYRVWSNTNYHVTVGSSHISSIA